MGDCGRYELRPYYSVKLERAIWPVILSAAKNLSWHREILRCTQNDRQHGAMKVDRVLHVCGRSSALRAAAL